MKLSCQLNEDSTLILPSISIGNVGQLAIDMIITTLNCKRIGSIESQCLFPVAGDQAAQIEVYATEHYTILQIRSNIIYGLHQQFIDELKALRFKATIVLTGLDSTRILQKVSVNPKELYGSGIIGKCMQATIIGVSCVDGDNVQDAKLLVVEFFKLLDIQVDEIKQPDWFKWMYGQRVEEVYC